MLLDEFDLNRTRLSDRAAHIYLDPIASMRRFGEDPADMRTHKERPDTRRLLPLLDGCVEIVHNPSYLVVLLCYEHFLAFLMLRPGPLAMTRSIWTKLTRYRASLNVTIVDRSIYY